MDGDETRERRRKPVVSRLIPVVLRDANFRRFWTAQTVSYMGDQVTSIALPLIAVLGLNASPAQMGILGAAQSLPSLLFSIHAGVLVDRRGMRRSTMIAMDLIRAAMLATLPVAYFLSGLTMIHLLIVAFVTGAMAVLFNVCAYSLFAAIVPRDHFLAGNALCRGSFSFSWIAGPSVGGLLIQVISAPFVILLDVLSFLGSAFMLRTVSVAEPKNDESKDGAWAGLCFVGRTRVLLAKFVAGSALNLFYTMYFTLVVLFAATELHLTPGQIGLVLSGGAAGALLGSVLTTSMTSRIGLGATFIAGSFAYPAALALTPLATGSQWTCFAWVLVGEFVSGIGLMMCDVAGSTIQQALTPDRLRSRVQGAHMAVNYGVRPLGALIAGGMGTWLGVRPTLWVAVIGGALSVVPLFWSPIPRMRELPAEATV